MSVESILEELGLNLPTAPPPAANYAPFVRSGSLLFLSGQLPISSGELRFKGHVGAELTIEDGYEAARLCALNLLSQIKVALGGFERVERVVRLEGFVGSAPGFTDQPLVVNGASDLILKVFGDRGRHSRMALGAGELPLGAAVELAGIVAIR